MERNLENIKRIFRETLSSSDYPEVMVRGNTIKVEYDSYDKVKFSFSDLEHLKFKIGFDHLNIERDGHRSCETCGSWGGEITFVMWSN